MDLNYEKLEFKAGLEIHAQLETKKKLFCHCNAKLVTKKPDYAVKRKFRPVLSEMGQFDKSMLLESEKDKIIVYEGFDEACCTYELDETPPFRLSSEALSNSIILASLLSCKLVDEVTIMRKNYIDGSVPTGFQRTALIGFDGSIPIVSNNGEKELSIKYLYLEEDAARIDSETSTKNCSYFKLDRFGIPLVEIVTTPCLKNIDEVYNAAKRLGMLLKYSKKIKRGIGTIRQDVNVSIVNGARVELKGLAKLELIKIAILNEITRQKRLLEIKNKLSNRHITSGDVSNSVIKDVSDVFENTQSKIIRDSFDQGRLIYCLKLSGFANLLDFDIQKDHGLGAEFADLIRSFTDLKGIIHSDENVRHYGLTHDEVNTLYNKMKKKTRDALVLIIGEKKEILYGIDFIIERAKEALSGVPQETRQVLADGRSRFIRKLHGKNRLYPDTDSPIYPLKLDFVKNDSIQHFKYPWDLSQELIEKYDISKNQVDYLITNGYYEVFRELVEQKISIQLLVNTFTQTLTTLARDGVPIDNLKHSHFYSIFEGYKEGKFSKEALPKLFEHYARHPQDSLDETLLLLDLKSITLPKLQEIIVEIISKRKQFIIENKMTSVNPLMGILMNEVRGKIDGKIVRNELESAVKKALMRWKNDETNP